MTEIIGEEAVSSVEMKNVKTGEISKLATDGVFIFIGHLPNNDLFKDQLEIDDLGYLVVDEHMQTNVPGVYAAGEIADPIFRQVITSAGMGAAASMQAIHFIEALEDASPEVEALA